jgi:DNA-binding transcriptional LysR family regulator
MDRRRLLSFIALAEELHFERAAARSHITQPAMSQQLMYLEEQVGVRLVYRNKRRVSLTRAGEVFLGEARRIVAQMDGAARLARQIDKGAVGQLIVGVTSPALYIAFPEIVAHFRAALPNVSIVTRDMMTAEQEEALRAGEIQVGIVHPPLVDDSLVSEEVARTVFDVVLCEHNPLAAKPELSLQDLAHQRFIIFPRLIAPRLYDGIMSLCNEAGFSPEVVVEAFPAQSIVALAACDFGVGFIASRVQHFNRPLVTYRKLSGPAPILTIGAAYRRDEVSPLVQAFVQAAHRGGREVV